MIKTSLIPMEKHLVLIRKRIESRRVIDSTTNCWLYQGTIDHYGYGIVGFLTKDTRVHRLSAVLYLGLAINELWYSSIDVLHKQNCPNKHCFNPEHLYLGNQSDNIKDAVAIRTHNQSRKENCPVCGGKYTEHIRKYGFSKGQLERICKRCKREKNMQRKKR